MRLSPRRLEKQGQALGSRVLQGEGRAFHQPQGPHMGLSTSSGPEQPAQVPSITLPGWGTHNPKLARDSSYAGSYSPMQKGTLTCHGAAGKVPRARKNRGTVVWWHKPYLQQSTVQS